MIYVVAIDNGAQNFVAISAIEVGSRAYAVAVNAIVAIALVKAWSRWSCKPGREANAGDKEVERFEEHCCLGVEEEIWRYFSSLLLF